MQPAPSWHDELALALQVVKEQLNPNWNETFVFPAQEVQNALMTSPIIIFEVWDSDTLSDDFLGQVLSRPNFPDAAQCSLLPACRSASPACLFLPMLIDSPSWRSMRPGYVKRTVKPSESSNGRIAGQNPVNHMGTEMYQLWVQADLNLTQAPLHTSRVEPQQMRLYAVKQGKQFDGSLGQLQAAVWLAPTGQYGRLHHDNAQGAPALVKLCCNALSAQNMHRPRSCSACGW